MKSETNIIIVKKLTVEKVNEEEIQAKYNIEEIRDKYKEYDFKSDDIVVQATSTEILLIVKGKIKKAKQFMKEG